MLSFTEKELQKINEQSGETTWHAIAKNGNADIIRKNYFDLDLNEINSTDVNDKTPLEISITYSNAETAKELINCGAKLIFKDEKNKSKLFKFVIQEPEMFKVILSAADDKMKQELFREACLLGSVKCADELIKAGVKLETKFDNKGMVGGFALTNAGAYKIIHEAMRANLKKDANIPSSKPSATVSGKMDFSLNGSASKS